MNNNRSEHIARIEGIHVGLKEMKEGGEWRHIHRNGWVLLGRLTDDTRRVCPTSFTAAPRCVFRVVFSQHNYLIRFINCIRCHPSAVPFLLSIPSAVPFLRFFVV